MAVGGADYKKILEAMATMNGSPYQSHMADVLGYGGLVGGGGGGGLGSDLTTNSKVKVRVPQNEPSLLGMIASRMRWSEGSKVPFDWIDPHQIGEGQVAIFMVVEGRALIIHDDTALFPSDALITQLRLLEPQ